MYLFYQALTYKPPLVMVRSRLPECLGFRSFPTFSLLSISLYRFPIFRILVGKAPDLIERCFFQNHCRNRRLLCQGLQGLRVTIPPPTARNRTGQRFFLSREPCAARRSAP